MLIRSQDKTGLFDMQGTEIFTIGDEIRMSKWVDHHQVLGRYSTREKVIEILDEIDNIYFNFINSQKSNNTDTVYTTFQMPADEEVKTIRTEQKIREEIKDIENQLSDRSINQQLLASLGVRLWTLKWVLKEEEI